MKTKLFSLLIFSLLISNNTFAQNVNYHMQKQNEVEFKRISQEISLLKEVNEQQAKYIRTLESTNHKLEKKIEATQKRIEDLIDLWVNFENVSLPNLTSADNSLAKRINQTNTKIQEKDSTWNWGQLARDCPSINSQHQQVKTVISSQGEAANTYLCFDGKVLHLKTESNLPLKQ